eukprot:g5679.t1
MAVSPEDFDFVLKLIVLGDSGVGKSNLIHRFTSFGFNAIPKPTIGVDFAIKYLEVNDKIVKAQIWDTAGQERFKSITSSYYDGVDGAIVAFDLTRPDTFTGASFWLSDLAKHVTKKNFTVILVGNKSDLDANRKVTKSQIVSFCVEKNLSYVETSALTPVNVDTAFDKLCTEIIAKQKRNNKEPKEQTKVFRGAKRRGCLALFCRYVFWCR